MALVVLGVTTCPLCEQPIDDPEGYVGFPHFIDDEQDPFWPYSDAALHRSCLDTWPKKEEFLERLEGFEHGSSSDL